MFVGYRARTSSTWWLDELKRVWRDARYYEFLRGEAEREAQKHDIEANLDKFIAAVGQVCPKFAALAPAHLRNAAAAEEQAMAVVEA